MPMREFHAKCVKFSRIRAFRFRKSPILPVFCGKFPLASSVLMKSPEIMMIPCEILEQSEEIDLGKLQVAANKSVHNIRARVVLNLAPSRQVVPGADSVRRSDWQRAMVTIPRETFERTFDCMSPMNVRKTFESNSPSERINRRPKMKTNGAGPLEANGQMSFDIRANPGGRNGDARLDLARKIKRGITYVPCHLEQPAQAAVDHDASLYFSRRFKSINRFAPAKYQRNETRKSAPGLHGGDLTCGDQAKRISKHVQLQ